MNRRNFIQTLGLGGGTAAFLAAYPWFSALADEVATLGEKARLGIIGPGSRGRYLMNHLLTNPKVEITALCDNYVPSLDAALKLTPKAKTYADYRALLDDKNVDGVIIATPPALHCSMLLDSFAAGKHAFVEKAFSIHPDEVLAMYKAYEQGDKVMSVGHQRLFDPKYIVAMERLHAGEFGNIQCIRMNWDRNMDWRRNVPSPDLERQINWRLYKDTSRGIMTELASHQLQVGNWAMQALPSTIMGHGAIVDRKDGREVYDNISCIYAYDNGVKMTFDSTNSNAFYGLEERILCNKAAVVPQLNRYYPEASTPASGILRLINDMEKSLFSAVPFAGASWAPENAKTEKGTMIVDAKDTSSDGSRLLLEAFAEAVITGKKIPNIVEEGYYSSMLCLLGHQAMEEESIITFPDKYKINYLNHKAPVA